MKRILLTLLILLTIPAVCYSSSQIVYSKSKEQNKMAFGLTSGALKGVNTGTGGAVVQGARVGASGINPWSRGSGIRSGINNAFSGYNPNAGNATVSGAVNGYNIGSGNSSGGGGVNSAPAPDPYAQWGGQAAYNNLVSGFNSQKSNIFGTAHDAAVNAANGLHGSIQDFIESIRSGQGKINNQGVQNELSRQQGVTGVQGMVGRGIKSSGVMLANRNAGSSSAAQGLTDAYGQLGRGELTKVGQQYALGQNAIDQAQSDLEMQRGQGIRHINDSKVQAANSVATDARNQLAALDAAMANASLPDRIDIAAEKERVKQDALSALSQYDQELNQGNAGITASSQQDRRIQANQLASQGQAPADAFNFTTQAPAQFQNSGPFASELPLFTFRGRRATA